MVGAVLGDDVLPARGRSGDAEAGPEVGETLLKALGAGPEVEAGAEARGGAS